MVNPNGEEMAIDEPLHCLQWQVLCFFSFSTLKKKLCLQLRYLQTQNVAQNHGSNNSSVFYALLIHIITRSSNGQQTVSEWWMNSLSVHFSGSARVNIKAGSWKILLPSLCYRGMHMDVKKILSDWNIEKFAILSDFLGYR